MKIKQEAGFTLVEILIVVAIIGVLTGLGAINMSRELKKSRLKEATTQLYSDIKKCRSDAMSKATAANSRGFGFKFNNTTTYQTFEFNDVASPAFTYTAATETLNPATVTVPNGVQIKWYDSGILRDPVLLGAQIFDHRGWTRAANWSTVGGCTFIVELANAPSRCVVLSTSQVRQGVWDNATTTCNSN